MYRARKSPQTAPIGETIASTADLQSLTTEKTGVLTGARKSENQNYFNGIIHDVSVCERTLSADETRRISAARSYPPK